jgi:hypothetical protein
MLTAIVFLLVVTGVIVGAISVYSRRINGTWATVAEELGLRYTGGNLISGPKIRGDVESAPVEVTTVPDMSNGYTLTRVAAAYPSLGIDLHLEAASADAGTSNSDMEFEDRFAIVTDAPETLHDVLTPARRTALLELLDSYPSLEATDTTVSVTTTGTVSNPATLAAIIRDLVTAAKVLGAG